ncbi:MAG: hypothetical protein JST23_02735 [Bacteroidetes bacterium]|nr:hypothetical protein [Bacteroidota bacterium]
MENKKLEEILNSLDGVQKTSAPDFFYTRLKARMERGTERLTQKRSWYLQPIYIAAILLFVIAANAFVYMNSKRSTQENTAKVDHNEMIQLTVASDFNQSDNSFTYFLSQGK